MKNRHPLWTVVASTTVAACVMAACGSSSKSTSTTAGGTTATTAAPSGTGSSGGSVQGITATTITVGQLADVSGPVPGVFTGAVNGLDAWAAYVNSTGGIAGRKVIVDHKDSGLSCTLYTSGIKELASTAFAIVGSFSLADGCGAATLKANPNLPDIEASVLNPSIASIPNVFGVVPATSGYPTTGYQWIKDKYGASAVAHAAGLYSQASTFDFSLQEAAAKSIGFNYLYTREFGDTETNYTSDILRMKSDNVQVVDLVDLTVNDLADFMQQANQQGFHPEAVLNTTGYDPTLFKLLGTSSFGDPLVFSLPYAMYLGEDAASVPAVTTFNTWLQKTHPGYSNNLFALEGYGGGLLFQQAMSTLGSNPTQQQLLGVLSKITAFTGDGLFAPSNVGQKKGVVCSVIVRPVNGKFVRIDPASSGFQCNGTFVYSTVKS